MKNKIIILILISVLLIGCEGLFEDNYSWRQFTFKNYTEHNYSDTKISAGEIIENKIIIYHTENIGNILPKANNNFTETQTVKTEIWDRVFLDFIKSYDDTGCFLIEFSDDRKLFIEVGYYGDFGDELNAANLYEIDITENNIETTYKSTEINGIAVENFEIVR
jgi:hypothetical protein